MSEPLLRIRNHLSPGCGDPPIVNCDDPAVYIGYFENAYGEQWIFTYDHREKKGELRGGDVDWNESFPVQEGSVPGLILNRAEPMWLAACWQATLGK